MILHLICDTSGSMSEGAKHLIVRGMVRAVEQYFRLGHGYADLKLISWSNEARITEWIPDDEFPSEMLICEGTANAKALISFFGEFPKGKILLFTDGFWAQNDAKALKRWKENLQPGTLRIIKAGVDTNPQLKGIDVFTSENLFAALDGWLEGGTE